MIEGDFFMKKELQFQIAADLIQDYILSGFQ